MKMIYIAIIIVLVVLICFGLYNASQLTTIEIRKSVTINAPADKVYTMIASLQDYPKWSPFLEQDPAQQYSVKGNNGQAGSEFHWNGQNGKDLGYQKIVSLTPNNEVKINCYIEKPFTAAPVFTYQINPISAGSEVIQTFRLESGLIDAFFLWLFKVKPEMETTNQRGLLLLKKAGER